MIFRSDDFETDSIGTISTVVSSGFVSCSMEFPNGTLAIGTSNGFMLCSTDQGRDWKKLGDKPFSIYIHSLALDSSGHLLALLNTSEIYRTTFNVLGVEESHHPDLPNKFTLSQNYPNPFNPTTKIEYAVSEAGHVSLKLYNVLGQVVRVLVDEVQNSPGYRSVTLDAGSLPSGMYIYRLEAGGYTQVRKLLLTK